MKDSFVSQELADFLGPEGAQALEAEGVSLSESQIETAVESGELEAEDATLLRTPLVEPLDPDAPLACGLTRREINVMRKAGLSRPSFVSVGDWAGPQKLSQFHMYICYLAASGKRYREIIELTGIGPARLSILMNSPLMKQQIQLIREVEFRGLGTRQAMDRLAPVALENAREALTSPSTPAKIRWQATQFVLEQKLGKARQHVEMGGSLLKDMFDVMQKELFKSDSLPAEGHVVAPESASDSAINSVDAIEVAPAAQPQESASEWLGKRGL